jgi:hypothetical protein
MRAPFDELYFNWLCAKVLKPGRGSTYIDFLAILHRTEFVNVVYLDRHRTSEGIDLRLDFRDECDIALEPDYRDEPCSVLELLIAFAKRLEFQTRQPVRRWFWEFMENLNLTGYTQVSAEDEVVIMDILDTWIWRQYEPNGQGGLFPLMETPNDQRKVELWYQFAEYAKERRLY